MVGMIYGLVMRLCFNDIGIFIVMSSSFILVVPLALGFVTVWCALRGGKQPWYAMIYLPWVASLGFMAGTFVFHW